MDARSMQHRRARRGITLIEAVVSLVIISVLMLGLSSSVVLGTYALPSDTDLGTADREAQDICNLMRDEFSSANAITVRKSGTSMRLTLDMQTSGALGEGRQIVYDLIPDARMIRRRVDARSFETLSMGLDAFRATVDAEDSRARYIQLRLRFNDTIQQYFELFIPTPYRPEVK